MTSTSEPTVGATAVDSMVVNARTDRGAFGKLYSLYYPRILRYCLRRLFLRALAEDVTAEVFLAVSEDMSHFKGQIESDFRNWIYAIATNRVNAHIRRRRRRERLLEEAAHMKVFHNDSSASASDRLDWPVVYSAAMRLKRREQSIIGLRFFEGLSHEQIGAVLGLKPVTVRVTLTRALARLRQDLGEERIIRFD